jgi:hypothetical protein
MRVALSLVLVLGCSSSERAAAPPPLPVRAEAAPAATPPPDRAERAMAMFERLAAIGDVAADCAAGGLAMQAELEANGDLLGPANPLREGGVDARFGARMEAAFGRLRQFLERCAGSDELGPVFLALE